MSKKDPRRERSATQQGLIVGRRSFFKLLPALGAAGIAATHIEAPSTEAQQPPGAGTRGGGGQQPQSPQRITKEMLHAAEQMIALELTDAQEAMALPGVNRNLASYEAVRKIEVPLDTEPAIAFHPSPPGKKFSSRREAFNTSKVAAPAFKSIEDLAFATATELGELVRTRKISPV